jgi:hypothetical protein
LGQVGELHVPPGRALVDLASAEEFTPAAVPCLLLGVSDNVAASDGVLDGAIESVDDAGVCFADGLGKIAERSANLTRWGREYISVHREDLSPAPARARLLLVAGPRLELDASLGVRP